MPTLDRPRLEYRTPVDMVADVQAGRLRLPPLQRGFQWSAGDVIELFDSVLRGYPVGNLLLWRRGAPAQRLRVGPLDIDAPAADSALWVVDGQQRITSLVGALVAADTTTDPRFRIYLDLDEGLFRSAGTREEPGRSWAPVSVLIDTRSLLAWLRDNADGLPESQLVTADQAARSIRDYQIPAYVVTAPTEEPLVEIFRRTNAAGRPLAAPDVFAALHSAFAGVEPADLASLGRVPAGLGFGTLDGRLTASCLLAYRGGDILREDIQEEFDAAPDRLETFRNAATLLREVVTFLQGEAGIPHVRLLPQPHVLPVLVRFARTHGVPTSRAATLLRRWVWRGAAAGSAPERPAGIRDQLTAVEESDQFSAASAILRTVPVRPGPELDLDEVRFDRPAAKVSMLGLLSAGPRHLTTGAPLDIVRVLESGTPLRPIIELERVEPDSIANWAVSGPVTGDDRSALRGLLAYCPPEIAASHLVDAEGQRLLRAGDVDRFLARRADAVVRLIAGRIDEMAEWGARDGRAMSDVIRSVG